MVALLGNEANCLQSSGPESRGQALAVRLLGGEVGSGMARFIFSMPRFVAGPLRALPQQPTETIPRGRKEARALPGEERPLVGLAGGHGLDPFHPVAYGMKGPGETIRTPLHSVSPIAYMYCA